MTGLTQNADYIFRVRAINTVGNGCLVRSVGGVHATGAWCADGCGGVECDVDVDRCVVDAAG